MAFNMDFPTITSMEPIDLLKWLMDEFSAEIPEIIVTPEDLNQAEKTLLKLSSFHSYLMSLLSYTKIRTRQAKRNDSKEMYEDMVDRKDIIQNITDGIKHNYAAVSRAVTIYIQNNEELKMGRGTP